MENSHELNGLTTDTVAHEEMIDDNEQIQAETAWLQQPDPAAAQPISAQPITTQPLKRYTRPGALELALTPLRIAVQGHIFLLLHFALLAGVAISAFLLFDTMMIALLHGLESELPLASYLVITIEISGLLIALYPLLPLLVTFFALPIQSYWLSRTVTPGHLVKNSPGGFLLAMRANLTALRVHLIYCVAPILAVMTYWMYYLRNASDFHWLIPVIATGFAIFSLGKLCQVVTAPFIAVFAIIHPTHAVTIAENITGKVLCRSIFLAMLALCLFAGLSYLILGLDLPPDISYLLPIGVIGLLIGWYTITAIAYLIMDETACLVLGLNRHAT